MFICPNCGNDNPLYFAMRKGNYYCRKCISFLSQEVVYELREDVAVDSVPIEDLLANSDDTEDREIVVPKVVG